MDIIISTTPFLYVMVAYYHERRNYSVGIRWREKFLAYIAVRVYNVRQKEAHYGY